MRDIYQDAISVANEVSTESGSDRVSPRSNNTYLIANIRPLYKTQLVWNDTDIPLAHLITFRCYGTWLHGDERGSIDRFHNRYKSPYIAPNATWHRHNAQVLQTQPVTLDAWQRQSVEDAIRETCTFRQWHLHAVNARTNHVHAVVSIGLIKPERALTAFKANATRQMRQDGCWRDEYSPWAEKGSKRYLWNERSLARAIEYVLYGQGDELPHFDDD